MAKKKKAKQEREELSFYERTGRYEVISETETETEITAVLKTYSGATVICHIPKLPPEEDEKREREILKALCQFANPHIDINKVKRYGLIIDDD